MDILSHGLWGGVALGRKNKRDFWWAFFFGIAPDLFSFGLFTGMVFLGFASGPDWGAGLPDERLVPFYVHGLYNITHSLVIFASAFFAIWLIRKKPFLPMLAWLLHILLDIPTHSTEFFATPMFWPILDIKFSGIPWSHPLIFIPNVILLALSYVWFFVIKPRRQKSTLPVK